MTQSHRQSWRISEESRQHFLSLVRFRGALEAQIAQIEVLRETVRAQEEALVAGLLRKHGVPEDLAVQLNLERGCIEAREE